MKKMDKSLKLKTEVNISNDETDDLYLLFTSKERLSKSNSTRISQDELDKLFAFNILDLSNSDDIQLE